ncbi:MAG TPA: VC0807 family protein [Candidatus Methylacidiphilales bacterium]
MTSNPRKYSVGQFMPTIIFDLIMPVVLFDSLSAQGVPALWAMAVGTLSPALNTARVWTKTRRVEPLGLLVMLLLIVGTLGSLISGSLFLALVKDSFLTATFGFVCLGSLLAPKPLLFSVVRQFDAGEDPVRIELWNTRWENPIFRGAFRFVTIVWGLAYMVEALIRVSLAILLTPQAVVTLSPFLGCGFLVILAAWTRYYMGTILRKVAK